MVAPNEANALLSAYENSSAKLWPPTAHKKFLFSKINIEWFAISKLENIFWSLIL